MASTRGTGGPGSRRIPVTVVTGFLGSGKTTLLNYILSNKEQLRVGVLMNELGVIDIDSRLLVSTDSCKDTMQLSNGCVCCTLNTELQEAVQHMVTNFNIDYLVIETTGVADPFSVVSSVQLLDNVCFVDACITVVNADLWGGPAYETVAAQQQVLCGDTIVINKTDTVTAARLDTIEAEIKAKVHQARLLRAVRGKVPLQLLLDTQLLRRAPGNEGNGPTDEFTPQTPRLSDHERRNPGGDTQCNQYDSCTHEDHHHSPHEHTGPDIHSRDESASRPDYLRSDGFSSVAFISPSPLHLGRFLALVAALPTTIFRAKGFVRFAGIEACDYMVHLSGRRWEAEIAPRQVDGSVEFVVIGVSLDVAEVRRQLDACVMGMPEVEAAGRALGLERAQRFRQAMALDFRLQSSAREGGASKGEGVNDGAEGQTVDMYGPLVCISFSDMHAEALGYERAAVTRELLGRVNASGSLYCVPAPIDVTDLDALGKPNIYLLFDLSASLDESTLRRQLEPQLEKSISPHFFARFCC
jgi:G3E family GTPase